MEKLFKSSGLIAASMIFAAVAAGCKPDEPTPTPDPTPSKVSVTSVSLNKTTLSLVEGGSESLTATVAPTNATDKSVSWKSSDAATAAVDNSGKVTAVKAGSATITVTTTDGSKTATCSVTVTSKTVNVTGVTLDKTEIELTEGTEETLKATIAPADASNQVVTWSTSDHNIANVSDGKVTAVKEGEATITVTTSDGSKTATCKVTVKAVLLEGIAIDPAELSIKEGEEKQLQVVFTPDNYGDKSVNWASDNTSVATVDHNGLLKAIGPGECKIFVESAKDKTFQASCVVTVTPDPTLKGISFPYTSLTMKKGDVKQIQVSYYPEYAENKKVTWKSSNPAAATVDSDGKVTAVWNGETEITATSQEGGFTATCKVTVSQQEGAQVYFRAPEGVFLNGDKYERDYISDVFSDGTDLYECYLYGGIWKNGSQLVKMYDPGYLRGAAEGKLYFIDTYSINIYEASTGEKLFGQALSSDSEYRNTGMAVAPDGTAYVVGYCRDAFGKRVGRLWTISKDLKVSEQTLYDGGSEEVGLDVAVDSDGNVWALTRGKGLNLYKNGKLERVVRDDPDGNRSHFISFNGKDMYIVSTSYGQEEVIVDMNDKVLYKIAPG
ncbi:MAG: Ig-like domain-containing protein, partial [Bacteroidales bacterium]|nr:Ig-like domain-containing protein [Bacteroidales bacterium]